ncbi:MAG TPA: hypothetical protein PKA64_12665, partial [Myxococcota bacterium]|nr:hypothetical protein [Myxococcota bacterium]
PTRDGIYEALRSRATYATSGLRAQLDWTVSRGPITVRMGAEVDAGDVCSLDTWIELATGQNIRTISIWGAKVGSPDPWVPILFNQPVNRTLARVNDRIDNPVPSTGERERWVYFVRAFTGPQFPAGQSPFVVTQNHREAVWSSPIWVEWDPARCP